MLIGLISDTHRNPHMIEIAMEELKESDVIIHLGDNMQDVDLMATYYSGKIINVKGNCDFGMEVPSELVEIIGGKKIFITHGHNYDVKRTYNKLMYKAMEVGADIALFGHTHIPEIIFEEGIWIINPGSASMSRKGPNSIGFIEINDGKINAYIKEI